MFAEALLPVVAICLPVPEDEVAAVTDVAAVVGAVWDAVPALAAFPTFVALLPVDGMTVAVPMTALDAWPLLGFVVLATGPLPLLAADEVAIGTPPRC